MDRSIDKSLDKSYIFIPNRYKLEAYPHPEVSDSPLTRSEDGMWGVYSEYFSLKSSRIKRKFDPTAFLVQSTLILAFYTYFRTGIAIVDLFTIDSTLSAALFFLKWQSGFLDFDNPSSDYRFSRFIYQSNYIKRLLYMGIFLSGLEIFHIITWWELQILDYPLIAAVMTPVMTEEILFSYQFRKIYQTLKDRFDQFVYRMMSKQLGKVLVKVARNALQQEMEFAPDEFIKYLEKFTYTRIISFVSSFLVAALLHYLESGGTTIYTALLRQYYFREYMFQNEKREGNTKKYLTNLLKTRRWDKITDPYTLNRILQLYVDLADSDQDNIFLTQMLKISNHLGISFAKMMTAWSIMALVPFPGSGSLSYLLFCENSLHLALIALFTALSQVSHEQILMLMLCELTYLAINNPLARDIAKEINKIRKNLKGSLALLPVYLLIFHPVSIYQLVTVAYLVLHRTLRPSMTVDSMIFNLITSQTILGTRAYLTSQPPDTLHTLLLPPILQLIFFHYDHKTVRNTIKRAMNLRRRAKRVTFQTVGQ